MQKLVEKKVTQKQIEKVVNSELSKSKRFIELFELGVEIKEIANIMNVRYNFVYNVISNYVNINDNIQLVEKEKNSKKNQIIELFEQNKTMKEISIDLKTNYNYVFNVIKKYKEELNEKAE